MNPKELLVIVQQCGLRDLKEYQGQPSGKEKAVSWYSFTANFEGEDTSMLLGIDDRFPLSLPILRIEKEDEFAHIPHIERDGKVCYTHEDYTSIDFDSPPSDIIKDAFELAKNTIEKGLRKENIVDFTNEFEAYWNRIEGSEFILGNIEFGNNPVLIKTAVQEKKRFVISDGVEINRFMNVSDQKPVQHNALYIPLTITNLIPPRYGEILNINYFVQLVDGLPKDRKKILDRIISLKPQISYVFFSFVPVTGNTCLFGVRFSGQASAKHLINPDGFEGKIIPLSINRVDKEYMFKRGGLGIDPSNKKGLLIGGGSVGGFVAEELVRNGFFDLTIVDGGSLSAENCYRHLTGYRYLGVNKAAALKSKLESYFPHSKITAIQDCIEVLIEKGKIDLSEFAFIVYATGNVTINLYLSSMHQEKRIPTFYAWNDPYGIGGHCLSTNISETGCYKCLYSQKVFHNKASFAAVKQIKPFIKSISGCGSVYTPYGSSDSMKTCLLTLDAIRNYFSGKEIKNSVYSWKGDSELFLKEGYLLSLRYGKTEIELYENRHEFIEPHCKICKSK